MTQLALADLDDDQSLVEQPQVDRSTAARYFFQSTLWLHLLITALTFGAWLPGLLVWALGLGQWYAHRRAAEIDYRLLPGRLLVSDGVLNKVRKTIPLDKVTDLSLTQGIVERKLGLWRLNVQTASSGHAVPEASLFALTDPRAFRRMVLDRREAWLEQLETAGARPPGREPLAAYRSSPEATAREVLDRLTQIEAHLAAIADNTRR